jgi:UDP-2,3-diacylglucosamine pyrophosphatase LpxH
VVQFASRFGPFYRLYRKKLMLDAVKFAKKNGFEAIACGHTHYPEDHNVQGVRYINTGAWTEYPPHYLVVNEQELSLKSMVAQTDTVLSR